MDLNAQTLENAAARPGAISHYRLDFQHKGNGHRYIWHHPPYEDLEQGELSLLIDLNNVYMPGPELEKMVSGFLVPASGITALAFANCHAHNQQNLKRRLKSCDVKLFSRTAFFTDIARAKQWLKAQCAGV